MLLHPEISVLTHQYELIESILNQSFFDYESLVNAQEHAWLDCRIKYVEGNRSPAKWYNQAIEQSQGRYIALVFNEWTPSALNDLYSFFELSLKTVPDVGMVYGLAEPYDDKHLGEHWNLKSLKKHNILSNAAILIKRDVFDVVGGFDEDPLMNNVCCWDLWQRIGNLYSVHRFEKVLAKPALLPSSPYTPEMAKHQNSRRTLPLKTKKTTWKQKVRSLKNYLRSTYDAIKT